jgi:hypothetical protein
MSTRSTVIYDDKAGWHLYNEMLEDGSPLFLEIENEAFCFTGRVPKEIAEVIRLGLTHRKAGK